ncbi:Hypothetical predicted protein [Marmota monax]|uniref:Uncharacterized protein n=1 Tax=Marmota monax TaxID=9995 RepID=A0A5E4AGM6_MARMO|nr:hypothetical protein GHT09_003548 [Marmota monax]VTJ55901.1 Hypothetical predicted protein [Marmota monax]
MLFHAVPSSCLPVPGDARAPGEGAVDPPPASSTPGTQGAGAEREQYPWTSEPQSASQCGREQSSRTGGEIDTNMDSAALSVQVRAFHSPSLKEFAYHLLHVRHCP